jgi:hypothetical protein
VPPDAWLQQLDLSKEDLGGLADPELVAADPEGVVRDLDKVKALLVQYAGEGGMVCVGGGGGGGGGGTVCG